MSRALIFIVTKRSRRLGLSRALLGERDIVSPQSPVLRCGLPEAAGLRSLTASATSPAWTCCGDKASALQEGGRRRPRWGVRLLSRPLLPPSSVFLLLSLSSFVSFLHSFPHSFSLTFLFRPSLPASVSVPLLSDSWRLSSSAPFCQDVSPSDPASHEPVMD